MTVHTDGSKGRIELDKAYEKLADALNALPNGYTRTQTGSDLRLLEFLYTPDEAELASLLGLEWEEAEAIAQRAGLLPKEALAGLFSLVRQGKVWIDRQNGKYRFRLAPFIVGSYEASVDRMDAKMAGLVEDYLNDGGVYGIMQPQPALHRVIPAADALDLEWILPYDNVMEILRSAKTFHVQDCICRLQQESLGQGCGAPKHNCLSFSKVERGPKPGDITLEEAIRLIDEAEKAGLVHSVSNIVEGLSYICNCCGCCCGVLRGITKWGIENSMARANYEAIADKDACVGCGICLDRCQVSAIRMGSKDNKAVIDREKCLGCGLCVSTCAVKAIRLVPRPEAEQIKPPQDFGKWEHERLMNRGLL
jgi:ferredoxin